MASYVQQQPLRRLPRLPLSGTIDLTYRCNNVCRHCWLWLPPNAPQQQNELTFDEIKVIANDARGMGCRNWSISGGEPMLRPDFADIFDYLTSGSAPYTLNTNGTLITPEIAQLLKRKGAKMVAIYGATADVYDNVTRHPGGFDAVMRGMAYLKEAGAGFIVQIIPMRDNYHQMDAMVSLAQTLSPHYRIGAAWLYLAASGNPQMNGEIARQRLDPRDVIVLDTPDMTWHSGGGAQEYAHPSDGHLFTSCAACKNEFHIDAYGAMSFCGFIKDPAMRYDLRKGAFKEAWETFIPSLATHVQANEEYKQNCGACDMRSDCRWCPVYGYLEHQRFTAKVDYLCDVARAKQAYQRDWLQNHRRYFQCAGMTIQVDSDEPINETTFDSKFKAFEVNEPGEDNISLRHHFALPDMDKDLGQEMYRRPPWAIYKKGDSWIYKGISSLTNSERIHQVAVFNHDHTRARIYTNGNSSFLKGRLASITLFPTDQILLAQLLADRQGCYLHSSGVILDGQGLMFVGHSEAGKSTTVKMLRAHAQILCDDRNIVRHGPDGFRIYGTWSHGEVPDCSPNSAPFRAILFLVKDADNRLTLLSDKHEIRRRLLACLIKPFVTADWWQKTLSVIEMIANEVPCYEMHFDKSGEIVNLLRQELTASPHEVRQ